MPIINDFPQTIYVRDINEEQGKAFAEIKAQFSITSNNEVIKRLFVEFLKVQEERNKLKKRSENLILEIKRQRTNFHY